MTKDKSQIANLSGISPQKITIDGDSIIVDGSLDLRDTSITSLPDNLTVGGYLDLYDGSIMDMSNQDSQIKIIKALRAKGFIFADGILSKVVSHKGNVYKVINVGYKNISFIVTDGTGNYAHGETLKEAREDLIYKVVAKFDGDLPEEAKGTEWIGIYRAVTGACSSGTKNFVTQNEIDLNKSYTANEIAKMVKGAYGEQDFVKKLKNKS